MMPLRNYILFFLLWSVTTVLLCETAHRQSLKKTLVWVKRHIVNFTLNSILIVLFTTLIGVITRNAAVSCLITFVIFYLLSCVSYFKYAARNEPLFTSDIFLATKVMSVADSSNIRITRHILIPGILGIGLILTAVFLKAPIFGVAAGFITAFFCLIIFLIVLEECLKFDESDFTYLKRGFILGFMLNIMKYFSERKKIPFDRQRLAEYVPYQLPVEHPPDIKPHVIAILSESFWDITSINGLKLSRDPIPFFRGFSRQTQTGNLIVTPYGGGTCNVEAEFLLGVATRHFNLSNSFYHSYVKKKPVDSLARVFQGFGYDTTAIHTFSKYYYKRDIAFERMGFEKFIGLEDIPSPKYSGRYVADDQLTDLIINELAQPGNPKLVFAISMENHQPYNNAKYVSHPIANPVHPLNENLPGNLQDAIAAYARGIESADQSLKKLVGYLKDFPEPVVVLFFGDHLGAVGPDLQLFQTFGHIQDPLDLSPEQIRQVYAPPFLLWNNYRPLEPVQYPNTGANFLGNLLLDYCGYKEYKPEFYRLLDQVYAQVHALSRQDLFVTAKNQLVTQLPQNFNRLEEVYKMYEYYNLVMDE